MTIQDFRQTRTDTESGLSIVSIRRPDEAKTIQSEGGTVLWVDADREIRYQRVLQANRGRAEDIVTYEEFCAQEDREMYPETDDPFVLNMAGVRDLADIHLTNEFSSKEAFEADLIDRFAL